MSPTTTPDSLSYLFGFGNTFESEFIRDALPRGRNNPRRTNYYAEQYSGTAFTVPRRENQRTWLYRLQPSVATLGGDVRDEPVVFGGTHPDQCVTAVEPVRWNPLPGDAGSRRGKKHFVESLTRVVAAGTGGDSGSLSIYLYACTASMGDTHSVFYNADGDLLLVPQQGALLVTTEMGKLQVKPTEICVVPKGILFAVDLVPSDNDSASPDGTVAKGYVLEVCSNHGGFRLPELGPIGSNGLANARDFAHPIAWCVSDPHDYYKPHKILFKMDQRLHSRMSDHSPFNVAAWHGNYLPYKYDLSLFCAMNSVTYDHPDPSIYTVLTYPSLHPGTALADFVIFPPRVMATDSNTLRPPWFHRNCMSEYMGLIYGEYDAKGTGDEEGVSGFVPGGGSLHNAMVPHGPDSAAYYAAVQDECNCPVRFDKGLAFMFESCLVMRTSPAAECLRDVTYATCWEGLSVRCDWKELQGKRVHEEGI